MDKDIELVVLFVTYGDKYPNAKKNLLKYLSKINYKYEFITLDNLNLNIIHSQKTTRCESCCNFKINKQAQQALNEVNKC